MKKLIPLFLITTLGFTGSALAEGFNNGINQPVNVGFTGGVQSITSAAQAKQMHKDSWVTLQGNIVQHLGDKMYLFRDSSGDINVKIKGKLWQGRTVTPNDTVQITGEVDTHRYKSTDVEVKSLQVISVAK
ncbi:OB fold stress tolerance protein YgiW [Orbus sasakiae]|uniref:OB fold stress tolerance protein YgiW n=1 Tax=Orbus sasakiae TaxID=1078475 RepID=A0ABP9N5F8_9GAMM